MRLSLPWGRRGAFAATSRTLREAIEYDNTGYEGRRVNGASDDAADISEARRRQAIHMSRQLYHVSPAYGAVVERFAEHIVGDGIRIEVDNPKAQDWLLEQLNSPTNLWDATLLTRIKRLMVDGEYLIAATAPKRSKSTPAASFTIGRMDIGGLGDVSVDPWNADAIRAIRYRRPDPAGKTFGDEVLYPWAEASEGEPTWVERGARGGEPGDGPSVFVGMQLLRAATLGLRSGPLFTRILDKTAVLDDAMEQMARKVEYLNRFYLHITFKTVGDSGQKQSKDDAFVEKATKWAETMDPGAALVTDESVKVNAVTPEFRMVDAKAFMDVMLEWVLGGHGFPRMWFASGGDTGHRTAVEQGSPIYRSIASYQAYVASMLQGFVGYLLDIGRRAGVYSKVPEHSVTMSDVATRDSLRDADEVARVLLFLNEAVRRGDLTEEESQAIARATIGAKSYGDHMDDSPPPLDDPEEDEAPEIPEGFGGEAPAADPQVAADKGVETRALQASLPVHRLAETMS